MAHKSPTDLQKFNNYGKKILGKLLESDDNFNLKKKLKSETSLGISREMNKNIS
jgi:hypothetical protein